MQSQTSQYPVPVSSIQYQHPALSIMGKHYGAQYQEQRLSQYQVPSSKYQVSSIQYQFSALPIIGCTLCDTVTGTAPLPAPAQVINIDMHMHVSLVLGTGRAFALGY